MIPGLIALLVCQLCGTAIADAFGLPVPGPVIGMVLLFGFLVLRRPADDSGVVRAAEGLLRHLPLFFIPAGVGFIAYLPELARSGVPIVAGLVTSWLVGLIGTAGVATLALRLEARARTRAGRGRIAAFRRS